MEEIRILWTSGWDSTFRLLQIVHNIKEKNVKIQPIYIIDRNRGSFEIEINTMKNIIQEIKGKYPYSINQLNPIKYIELKDIKIPEDIQKNYLKLREESFMGSQYEWLAVVSKEFKGLELCIHKDDKAHYFLKDICEEKFKIFDKIFALDLSKSSSELQMIFGDYNFPLFNYTKLEMKEEAIKKGFNDIMDKTWFCFTPINQEPCGICNPCKYSIEEGMKYRFSKKALLRNRFTILYKIVRKIKKITSFN